MNKQFSIKKVVTLLGISFIINILMMAGNMPRDASAFTLQSDVLRSAISEKKKESSQNWVPPGQLFLTPKDRVEVVLNQKKDDGLFQSANFEKWVSPFQKDTIPGGKRSDFNLIEGDFCLTGLDHSDRFAHFTEDRDDFRHSSSPSPVPLPTTMFLLGSGLAVFAGLTFRKEFIV
jgi:hypothetical protein